MPQNGTLTTALMTLSIVCDAGSIGLADGFDVRLEKIIPNHIRFSNSRHKLMEVIYSEKHKNLGRFGNCMNQENCTWKIKFEISNSPLLKSVPQG